MIWTGAIETNKIPVKRSERSNNDQDACNIPQWRLENRNDVAKLKIWDLQLFLLLHMVDQEYYSGLQSQPMAEYKLDNN